jgi:hypothetical protein
VGRAFSARVIGIVGELEVSISTSLPGDLCFFGIEPVEVTATDARALLGRAAVITAAAEWVVELRVRRLGELVDGRSAAQRRRIVQAHVSLRCADQGERGNRGREHRVVGVVWIGKERVR